VRQGCGEQQFADMCVDRFVCAIAAALAGIAAIVLASM
jgi:hypothetical protein